MARNSPHPMDEIRAAQSYTKITCRIVGQTGKAQIIEVPGLRADDPDRTVYIPWSSIRYIKKMSDTHAQIEIESWLVRKEEL